MAKEKKHGFAKRIAIDIAGFSMIIAAPLIGWLPGPGGIPLFLAGLGVLSLNYEWPERVIKHFDEQRVDFTERYLVKNKKVSRAIDIASVVLILIALTLILTQQSIVIRGMSVGLITLSIITLLSNQKRIDKLIAKHKRNKK